MTPYERALGESVKEKLPLNRKKLQTEPDLGRGTNWFGVRGRPYSIINTLQYQKETPAITQSLMSNRLTTMERKKPF